MSDMKTKANNQSVEAYLHSIEPQKKREDSFAIVALMQEISGEPPRMWGDSIIGFGSYHYKYASGREGDMPLTGFAPRKQNLTLYIMGGFDNYDELMGKLGKHTTGKACLYIKKLEDVDQTVLRELISQSVAHMRQTDNA
jgi:hypothetical protein